MESLERMLLILLREELESYFCSCFKKFYLLSLKLPIYGKKNKEKRKEKKSKTLQWCLDWLFKQ